MYKMKGERFLINSNSLWYSLWGIWFSLLQRSQNTSPVHFCSPIELMVNSTNLIKSFRYLYGTLKYKCSIGELAGKADQQVRFWQHIPRDLSSIPRMTLRWKERTCTIKLSSDLGIYMLVKSPPQACRHLDNNE